MQPTVEEQLSAVLAAFGGDVDAAEQALRKLASDRRKQALPPRSFDGVEVVVSLWQIYRQYKLGANNVGAVQGVTLNISQGEFIAITGPSGSGKSTLLNMIGGLDRPDSGKIEISGQDLSRMSDRRLSIFRNSTIGFIFQFFYLQPFLTVRTNLEVPGMFARLNMTERTKRVTELAEAVGLSDRLDHLPKELSGGQIQRAAIARALLNRPKLILADEPTGNVDRANARGIIELLTKVRDTYQTTVIIVTHDPEVAAAADRVIRLRDGQVVQ